MHISSGSDLTSPSGAAYKAKAALDAVDQLCPAPAAAAASTSSSVVAAVPAAAAASTASFAAAASLRASRPSSDGDGRARSGGLSLIVCVMAVAVAVLAVRHSRAALGRYLRQVGFFGGTRLPSTDYQVKDLGCYDSGGEAETADRERLRVRETPAMRDAV